MPVGEIVQLVGPGQCIQSEQHQAFIRHVMLFPGRTPAAEQCACQEATEACECSFREISAVEVSCMMQPSLKKEVETRNGQCEF